MSKRTSQRRPREKKNVTSAGLSKEGEVIWKLMCLVWNHTYPALERGDRAALTKYAQKLFDFGGKVAMDNSRAMLEGRHDDELLNDVWDSFDPKHQPLH